MYVTQLFLQTRNGFSTLKRRGNDRFLVVSTWNTRGVFVLKFQWTAAVAQICSVKKVFLKTSQNSHGNTSVRVSILENLLDIFTFDTEEYSLGVSFKVNDTKAYKNLYHHCSFILRFETAIHVYRAI